jgi:hypothetical protein
MARALALNQLIGVRIPVPQLSMKPFRTRVEEPLHSHRVGSSEITSSEFKSQEKGVSVPFGALWWMKRMESTWVVIPVRAFGPMRVRVPSFT